MGISFRRVARIQFQKNGGALQELLSWRLLNEKHDSFRPKAENYLRVAPFKKHFGAALNEKYIQWYFQQNLQKWVHWLEIEHDVDPWQRFFTIFKFCPKCRFNYKCPKLRLIEAKKPKSPKKREKISAPNPIACGTANWAREPKSIGEPWHHAFK